MTERTASKLSLLIPRLASSADGEVLATVAAIRRVLAAEGRDLHDLAARLGDAPSSAGQAPPAGVFSPSDLAIECLRSGRRWQDHERMFLADMVGHDRWAALSERQAGWLYALHGIAMSDDARAA